MIAKVRSLDMDKVSELLRTIEYYFILDQQLSLQTSKPAQDEESSDRQKYVTSEFI